MEDDSQMAKTLLYGQEVALFKDKDMPAIDGRRIDERKRAFMYSSGYGVCEYIGSWIDQ